VSAVPPDYDSDPSRFGRWQAAHDVHEVVAERLVAEGLAPVLDLGCGRGRLRTQLPASAGWIGMDPSPAQLREAPRPAVCAAGEHLPVRSGSMAAVTALWVLYHLARPVEAVAEASRVLRPGGLFAACSSRRDDAPELMPPTAPTTFDAEEAPDLVAEVFGEVEVQAWDEQLVELADRDEVRSYLVCHLADPVLADGVATPLRLTKRGVLVWARKRL
jgi:SAM-dependent methyltransferase